MRHLVIMLGDQLDPQGAALDGFDPALDALWMAEADGEATHVWSSKARIALFLAAMRHFRDAQRALGRRVHYEELRPADPARRLSEALRQALRDLSPQRVLVAEPGEWRLEEGLLKLCQQEGVPLEIRTDRHFLCTRQEFAAHAQGRKGLRMEYFYREMRRRTGYLMAGDQPEGGAWNFDAENRERFPPEGPGAIPPPRAFPLDACTQEVLQLVATRFASHPGSLEGFSWPLTPTEAREALADFIAHRLPSFGRYQDALWEGEETLYHSRLSAALNLKLLDPREVLAAALDAWRRGQVPLASVEGFVRQILGWREYVRGIYWLHMPGYLERNELGATLPLPRFYWTGETEFACLRAALGQTLRTGYAHHIQRLMVTGLFSLLLGVDPKQVHAWYLAVYVDAVEWVELPNTLGMSQYADGGLMASKPYIATGKYLDRMGNHCQSCPRRPDRASGPQACPFTTLYWDFLDRHAARLRRNPRMALQVKNLARLGAAELEAIRATAAKLRTANQAGGG